MRHYEVVGAVELAQGGLDLDPRRRALGVGGVHQQLRDLRQRVPDALRGRRERREPCVPPARIRVS
jgi:hypothetical protein